MSILFRKEESHSDMRFFFFDIIGVVGSVLPTQVILSNRITYANCSFKCVSYAKFTFKPFGFLFKSKSGRKTVGLSNGMFFVYFSPFAPIQSFRAFCFFRREQVNE